MVVYVILAFVWNANIPLFEGPDAYYHFAVIEHIHRTGELPPKDNPQAYPWQQMTYHAPLYHLISAVLISPIDTGEFTSEYRLNTHAQIGEPGAQDNQNFIAHVNTPLAGTTLAVYVVRVFGMILGALSIIGIYVFVSLFLSEHDDIAPLAAGLVALNPQFLFMHSIISNDLLVITLNTWVLVLLIFIIRRGCNWRIVGLMGVLLALGALTKVSGVVLYPVVILALLFAPLAQEHTTRQRISYVLVIGAMAGVISGWWYVSNFVTLGDLTATSYIAQATGSRSGAIADLSGELLGMFYSFWGLFGWFNIPTPDLFYHLTAIIVVISVIGIVIALLRSRTSISRENHAPDFHAIVALLLIYVALFMVSWFSFHLQVNAAQGRLLFPLLPVIALLMAVGLRSFGRFVSVGVVLVLLIASISFPLMLVAPVYAIDAPIASIDTWQAPENSAHFTLREPWQDTACMHLWVQPASISSSNEVTISSWWGASCEMTGYWSLFIHFVDVQQETCVAGVTDYILAQEDSMLQGGNLPIPAMRMDAIYQQDLRIAIPENLDPPREWHVQIGLYDAAGSFMRAFVTEEQSQASIRLGKCAPESVQFTIALD